MGAGLAAHLPRRRMARPMDRLRSRRRLDQLDRRTTPGRSSCADDRAPDRRRRPAHPGRGTGDPAGLAVLLQVEDQGLPPDHRPTGPGAGGPDERPRQPDHDERPPAARRLGSHRQDDAPHRQGPARPEGRGHLRSPGALPGASRQPRSGLRRDVDALGRGRHPAERGPRYAPPCGPDNAASPTWSTGTASPPGRCATC